MSSGLYLQMKNKYYSTKILLSSAIEMNILYFLSFSCVFAGTTVTNVFQQNEQYAIYNAVGISLHDNQQATFAVADGRNLPFFVEVYEGTGALAWSYSLNSDSFLVDTARHAEFTVGVNAVDTFAAALDSSGSTILGFSSLGLNTPNWTLSLPGCNTEGGIGGTYVGIESSDDGSTVAFLCHYSPSDTARVYGINGQTGSSWMFDLGTGVKVCSFC